MIQVLLGHSRIDTTARYTKVSTHVIAGTRQSARRTRAEARSSQVKAEAPEIIPDATACSRSWPTFFDNMARHTAKLTGFPLHQLRVMRAIEVCRTAALGGHVEKCDAMRFHTHRLQLLPQSPLSEMPERGAGQVARSQEGRTVACRILPCGLHASGRDCPDRLLSTKKTVYGILFRAAAETLLTIARDPKHLGAEIGFFAILHTWGQNLLHHPHVHCVVPGGGLSPDHERWISCLPGFFLPVRVLSRLFRRLFLEALEDAFYRKKAPVLRRDRSRFRMPCLRRPAALDEARDWVVYCQTALWQARNGRWNTSAVTRIGSPSPMSVCSR